MNKISSFLIVIHPLIIIFLDKAYKCGKCMKGYKYKVNLTKHIRYECDVEPKFNCPFCPYKSKQKGNLKTHVFKKHSAVEN